ncbi:ATP-binding protein [Sphaerisporangium sp. NPDC004334]
MGGLLGRVEVLGLSRPVKIAREYVRSVLQVAGRRDLDEVEVLVSEVVTNAVRHSDSGRRPGGVVAVRVYDDGETVRVEVTDEGSPGGIPMVPVQAEPFSESGRGLWLVRELSTSWGWSQDAKGHTVWFELRP